MDVYLYMLVVGLAPFLLFFGLIVPAISTSIVYTIVVVILDVFHKEFSQKMLKTYLIATFCLSLIISCSLFLYYTFRNGITFD
jgi:hypothetical protein